MNVGSRSVTANIFFAGFTSPVDIDEDEKEFITAAAEQLGCKSSKKNIRDVYKRQVTKCSRIMRQI